MNREYVPTFIGPTAQRDRLIYSKYALADRVLQSVVDLSEHIRIRVAGNPDPIDVIDVESKAFEVYGDLDSPQKARDILKRIKGIGNKTIETVLSKTTNILDLYNATAHDFERMGIGEKRANLLVDGIKTHIKELQ